jgi:MarR family transcriptional regulator, 2-MHQ and catechol-resistance regulon repressor
VSLTAEGSKTLADLDGPVLALHETLMGHISGAELKELNRLQEKIRESLAE